MDSFDFIIQTEKQKERLSKMTFGEKLKAIRKEKGYSQEEMAGLLDVSRQAVSKWESDRGIPEIDKLLQISNMFGVT